MSTTPQPSEQLLQHTSKAITNELVRVSPSQFQFSASKISPGQVSKVELRNLTATPVGYKFKTNAPMKYSVKPVLGVLRPDESIKVFVRSGSWISPQDRFLLQTIALTEEEGAAVDPRSWKALDPKRFMESYIPCASTSALSLRDLDEDAGSWSSSSAASSSASSPLFQAFDGSRNRRGSDASVGSTNSQHQHQPVAQGMGGGGQARKQVFERWQYAESTRPTISIGGLGRRLSSSSSTCSSATSSPGSYPTLFIAKSSDNQYQPPSPTTPLTTPTMAFSSKRGSISSNFHSSIITSTIKEEPATSEYPEGSTISATTAHLLSLLNISEKRLRSVMTKFKVFQQYSKRQVLLLSLVCLLFGMLMPLDRILHMVGGEDELAGDERGVLVRMREIRMDDTGSGQYGVNNADAIHDRHSDEEDGIVAQATAFYIAGRIAELNDMSIVQTEKQVEVIEGAV